MAFNAIYLFPKEIWQMFVANELNARTHSVQVYDHRNGIYCVTTGWRDNGKGGNEQIIHFGNRTCTCGKWTELRFPCSHVIVSCYRSGTNSHHLVGHAHTFSAWQASLQGQLFPLRDTAYWVPSDLHLNYDSTRVKQKRPGPKAIARIHNQMDRRCPDAPRCYSHCSQTGHNASNCPYSSHFTV